ncbi:MAG: hypothetical protein HRT44_12935 [Bdellovibrionales bacterium]|nr:hypothetical protein [Bdellovibrionales bacterium]NQZ20142.1 hypothetical protein [Bdellovibrionales bacterium]
MQCTGFHISAEDGRWGDSFKLIEGNVISTHDQTIDLSSSPMCDRRVLFQLFTSFAFTPEYTNEAQENIYKPLRFIAGRHFYCNDLIVRPNNAWGSNEIRIFDFTPAQARNAVLKRIDLCQLDQIKTIFEALNFETLEFLYNQDQDETEDQVNPTEE